MEESNIDTEWRALARQLTTKPVRPGPSLVGSPRDRALVGPAWTQTSLRHS